MEIIMDSINDILINLDKYTEMFLSNMGIMGALISCLLITVESILPVLPVCVFITLVFLAFGNLWGFIISWVFTCLGCLLSFTLFRTKVKEWFERKILKGKERKKLEKLMKSIDNISLSGLAILVAIPFTPASVVNVAAGLSNMSRKKFLSAMLIGKLFMVYFWGYIGTTLIECFTYPIYLVRILIMLLIAFIMSKIVGRYMNLE